MMAETDIKQALTQFYNDRFNVELPSTGTDLIDAGILDSLMLIEVVMFMETEFSVTAELDDLEIDNFISIDSMTRFITARQPATANAGDEIRQGERVVAAIDKGAA